MHRPMLIASAPAALGLALALTTGGTVAFAYVSDSPASNFSAYYYQSPGGLPRARSPSSSAGAADTKAPRYHRQSCGSGRVWKDDRCVRE